MMMMMMIFGISNRHNHQKTSGFSHVHKHVLGPSSKEEKKNTCEANIILKDFFFY